MDGNELQQTGTHIAGVLSRHQSGMKELHEKHAHAIQSIFKARACPGEERRSREERATVHRETACTLMTR